MTALEDNMGNCHPSKTNVNLGFASVNIGFLGVTISHVTLSCSQYLYNILCLIFLSNADQNRCYSEFSDDIQWNTTLAGTTKTEQCPPHQKGDSLEINIHKVKIILSVMFSWRSLLISCILRRTCMFFRNVILNLRLFFVFSIWSNKDYLVTMYISH